MESIKLALDWTPNTIHAGLLLALHDGRYREAGLAVELTSPEVDNYTKTPARRLAEGEVDFAIAPSESVLSYRMSRHPCPLVAVAAILQQDTSAVVTLKSSGLSRPAQLDHKLYASYSARFEDDIVRSMIRHDGGEGSCRSAAIKRLGIWDMLKHGEVDAAWVFMPWEGVLAQRAGLELNVFCMADYGIPYGYTPLILAHAARIQQRQQIFHKFLTITAGAYREVVMHPSDTARYLCRHISHPDFGDPAFIEASLRVLCPAQLTAAGDWGRMETAVWRQFIDWLSGRELIQPMSEEAIGGLFTNELLS